MFYLVSYSANISTAQSGDWNTGSTWVGGTKPGASDNAFIEAGHNITVTTSESCSGMYFSSGSASINISNNLSVTNFIYCLSTGNNETINMTVSGTVSCNKFWIISDNSNYIFNLTGSGSVSVSRSYIVYSLAGKDVIHNMSANVTATTGKFYTVSASGSTTINLSGSITNTVRTELAGTNATIDFVSAAATFDFGSTFSHTSPAKITTSNSSATCNFNRTSIPGGSDLEFPTVNFASSSSLNGDLYVQGDISLNSNISFGSNRLVLNGSSAQTITCPSSFSLNNLDISNSSGGVSLSGAGNLDINNQVSFTFAAATAFNTNGKLILKDGGSGIANLGNLNTHTISGNVTCEYRIPTLTNVEYRHISMPVLGVSIGTMDYDATLCSACPYSYGFTGSNGNTVLTAKSSYTYNTANVTSTGNAGDDFSAGWVASVSPTDALNPRDAMTWYIGPSGSFGRADYGVDVHGSVNVGPYSLTTGNSSLAFTGTGDEHSWALIGNPFPSAIDFSTVTKNNVSSDSYVFKADNGGYSIDTDIPAFQAFFVKASGSSPSLTFNESDKSTTQKVYQKNVKENEELVVKLIPKQFPSKFNYTYINFIKGTTNNFDKGIDKEPLTNPYPYANVSCKTADNKSTYRCVTDPEQEHIVIAINAFGYVAGNYEINFSNLKKVEGCVILEDKFTGQMINLSEYDSSYNFMLSDTTSISRFNLHVYNFTKDLKVENSTCFNANSGSVNLELHKHGSYFATWLKADMGIVEIGSISDHQKTITDLGPGNYSVEIESIDLGCPTTIEYFTIHEPSEIKTNFGFANQLLSFRTNKEIEFKNLSSGGIASYLWDFGDNQTSTEMNPMHSYDKTGIYDIVLTSENATPECNVAFKQSIEVAEATGFAELSNSTAYQLVYENGNYWVHFNAASKYDFNYSVYDIQGKKLSNGIIDKGTLVDELSVNGDGILLISINYNDKVETIKVHK